MIKFLLCGLQGDVAEMLDLGGRGEGLVGDSLYCWGEEGFCSVAR